MPTPQVKRVSAIEDVGVTLLSQVEGTDGALITRATIASIAYAVIDTYTGESIGTGSLTVSAVVFDTLQLDSRWTEDDLGYNFRHYLPAALLPEGGKIYRVEVILTETIGTPATLIPLFWDVHTLQRMGG